MLRRPNRVRFRPRWIVQGIGAAVIVVGVIMMWAWAIAPMLEARDARQWAAGTCTIVDDEIESSTDSDGDTYYRIRFRYELVVDGKQYTGTRLDFMDDTEHHEVTELWERYPSKGAQLQCWYDPDDPRRSVIERRDYGSARLLIVLVPLLGLLVIVAPLPRRMLETRLSNGRYRLVTRNARGWSVCTALVIAGVLDAIAIAAYDEVPKAALAFGAFGLIATIALVRAVCGFSTKVTVEFARAELAPGDALDATVAIGGPIKPTAVKSRLVGQEMSTWMDGSNARIDLRVFHDRDLQNAAIPADALPSLPDRKNRIDWRIDVEASIPWWPDVGLAIPIIVRGKRSRQPIAAAHRQDPIAMPATKQPLALLLDGDREHFMPGELITGTIAWHRDEPPSKAELQLAWESTSKHDVVERDVVGFAKIAELPRLVSPDSNDPYRGAAVTEDVGGALEANELRRLRFVAPDAPYSHDGDVFRVEWTLSLVVETAGEVRRVDRRIRIDGRGDSHERADRDADDDTER